MSLEDTLYPLLRSYEALPPWVKGVLGAGYRRLPQSWRMGPQYAQFKELASAAEGWSKTQIEEYQFEQLSLVLRHAGSYCPFYTDRFSRVGFSPDSMKNPGDLSGCPLLEKKDLFDHGPALVSQKVPGSQRLYITTGGSSGNPVGFYLQKEISRPKEQAFLEVMWSRAGYYEGARVAVIRGHVTSARENGPIHSYDATRDWLMLSSYHLTRARLDEYLDRLETFRPEFLHAYPSSALQLAEYLEALGQTLRFPLQALLCGSEQLTIPQKRLLERVFHCQVYRWYGHSERVVLAGEGRKSELFYFFPHYGYVEFGPPDEDGLQEVIGTSFHNLAMPLIRYRTGDYVRLAVSTPAGSPSQAATSETKDRGEFFWPAVVEVAGREHEFLVTCSGRRISLTALNMHDEIFDQLYAVQFYQDQPGRAEFRYLPGPRFHTSRLAHIEAGIRHKLGEDFHLEMRQVQDVEKTARGKHRWLVSTLS